MGEIKQILETNSGIKNLSVADGFEAEVNQTCGSDETCKNAAVDSVTEIVTFADTFNNITDSVRINQIQGDIKNCLQSSNAKPYDANLPTMFQCKILDKTEDLRAWGVSAAQPSTVTTPSTELPEKVKTVYDAIDVAVSLEPFDGTLALESLQTNVNDVATFLYSDQADKTQFAFAVAAAKSEADPAKVKVFLETIKSLIDARKEDLAAGQAEGEKEQTNATEGGENPPIDLGGGEVEDKEKDGKGHVSFTFYPVEVRGPIQFVPGGSAATGTDLFNGDELGYPGINSGRDVGVSQRIELKVPVWAMYLGKSWDMSVDLIGMLAIGELNTIPVDNKRDSMKLVGVAPLLGAGVTFEMNDALALGVYATGGAQFYHQEENKEYSMGVSFVNPTSLDTSNFFSDGVDNVHSGGTFDLGLSAKYWITEGFNVSALVGVQLYLDRNLPDIDQLDVKVGQDAAPYFAIGLGVGGLVFGKNSETE